jgi:regulator of cell morphogenesis and NO signaling
MTHLVTAERALDVRGRSAETAAAEALAWFDSLGPAERFVLVGADAGGETLRRLQAERPGAFEWSPLQSGPPAWRVEIARSDASRAAARGINEALSWDHDRLDSLEAAAFQARAAGDLAAAYDLYAEFAFGLRRHIGFEEDLLFPAFEAGSGMPPTAGPTAVMRAEHREILRLLEEIELGIGDAAAAVAPLRASFHAVLGEHNVKEEQVLYPAVDQQLKDDGADALVRRIQRYGS